MGVVGFHIGEIFAAGGSFFLARAPRGIIRTPTSSFCCAAAAAAASVVCRCAGLCVSLQPPATLGPEYPPFHPLYQCFEIYREVAKALFSSGEPEKNMMKG